MNRKQIREVLRALFKAAPTDDMVEAVINRVLEKTDPRAIIQTIVDMYPSSIRKAWGIILTEK